MLLQALITQWQERCSCIQMTALLKSISGRADSANLASIQTKLSSCCKVEKTRYHNGFNGGLNTTCHASEMDRQRFICSKRQNTLKYKTKWSQEWFYIMCNGTWVCFSWCIFSISHYICTWSRRLNHSVLRNLRETYICNKEDLKFWLYFRKANKHYCRS